MNKLSLSILHWVKFLIRDWIKIIKTEGLLKRLKNIECKNEKQLKAIEDQGKKQLDKLKNISESKPLKKITHFSKLSSGTKKLYNEIKEGKVILILKHLYVYKLMELSTTLMLLKAHWSLLQIFIMVKFQ